MNKLKQEKAITLIALVVTIIVLLILAGVSISMLTGENGILSRSTQASQETVHANVYEQLQLKVADYFVEKNLGNTTQETLIEYLREEPNPILEAELGEGSGKYQINVKNLLGTEQKYGNGTATGSDTSTYKDVYMLERVDTEDPEDPESGSIVNTKVASTKPIKIAVSGQTINYTVKYYGTETSPQNGKLLGNIGDTEGVSVSDIDKLKAYFNGNTYDNLHEDTPSGERVWKDNTQIGVKGKDLSKIDVVGEYSEDGKYYYEYIKYKTKIYKVKKSNIISISHGITLTREIYTDDIVEVTLTGTKGFGKLDDKDVFITEDGGITEFYNNKIEDDEYGTLYRINGNYYKEDGTLALYGMEIEKGNSKNIKEAYFIDKIYKAVEDRELEYTSNDTNIATVDSEGNVTGINEGNTKLTITGKKSGKTIDIMVRVYRPEIAQ